MASPRNYQTVVKRARFSATEFPAATMQKIAEPLRLSIYQRIKAARDVWDNPAPPLKQVVKPINDSHGIQIRLKDPKYQGYIGRKIARGRNPIRDWTYSKLTMDSLHVLQVGPRYAVIGFSHPLENFRAAINNRRWRQFGVSPKDRAVLMAQVHAVVNQGVKVIERVA